jgi:hypothetical protein
MQWKAIIATRPTLIAFEMLGSHAHNLLCVAVIIVTQWKEALI